MTAIRTTRTVRAGARAVIGLLLLLLGGGAATRLQAQQVVAVDAVDKTQGMGNDPLLEGTERFAPGATEVTEVNLDKTMMGMAAKFLKDDDEARRLMRSMEFVRVKSFEYGKEASYRLADVEQFRGRLDASWSHVVKQRSETEATDVWVKGDADGQLSELVVIAAEPKELTFVHLKGHMTMDELTRAGASYGVPQSGQAGVKLKAKGK